MNRFTMASVAVMIGLLEPAYGHELYKTNFGDLDRDQNNYVTLEEMSASIDHYFKAHDLDGDDKLDVAEFPSDKNQLRAGFKRVPKKKQVLDPMIQATALLERMDVDENGGLSFEELNASALKRFDAQDIDGDGELTAEELEASAVARAEKRSSKPRSSLSRTQKLFVKWDVNGDGFVTKAEVPKDKIQRNLAKIFADLDVNEDSKISIEEFSVILG